MNETVTSQGKKKLFTSITEENIPRLPKTIIQGKISLTENKPKINNFQINNLLSTTKKIFIFFEIL